MEKPILAALLSVKGTHLSDEEKRLFEHYNPLGVTLFTRNFENKEQAKQLVNEIKSTVARPNFLIAIDQEGGRVSRLESAGFSAGYASQQTLGTIGSDEIIQTHAALIAEDMHELGANLNFAPVLDIEHPKTTLALKNRCFGSNEKEIAKFGLIMCQTYIDNGICPCIKHMPGHGHAESDPHLGLPVITAPLSELKKDFYPFQILHNIPAGMTAHILLPEIDNEFPITLSQKGIKDIIRGRLNFDGLLISDAIDMKALRGSAAQKASMAWNAGCDVICYCFGKIEEMQDICRQGRFLDDRGLERLYKVEKVFFNNKKAIRLDNQRNKYYSLVNQFSDINVKYDATEILHQMQKGEN